MRLICPELPSACPCLVPRPPTVAQESHVHHQHRQAGSPRCTPPGSTRAARSSPPTLTIAGAGGGAAARAERRRRGAARGPGGAVRARRRAAASSTDAVRLALPDLRPAAARPAGRARGRRAAAVRPGRRPGVRGASALVGFLAGATLLGSVATGFALVAALLNAVFGFCLGCEVYLLLRRVTGHHREVERTGGAARGDASRPRHRTNSHAHRAPPGHTKGDTHMSRETALVTADWVEDNLDDPKRRPRRGRRGHHRLRQGPHPGRRQARLEDRPAGPGPPRLRRQGTVRGAAVRAAAIANDDTVVLYGGNNNWFAAYAYWYFKLYGHRDVKLLDGGRKKWELDSRELTDELPARAGDDVHRAGSQDTLASAPSATRSSPRSAPRTSSTCARPTSTPAGCSRRPTCRRSSPSAPGTSRPPRNVPWSKAANDDGTFKSDDELRTLYAEAGVDLSQGHHRLLPDRRALVAHLVRAARAARPAEREELRRLLDRVRLAGRRAGRPRRRDGC